MRMTYSSSEFEVLVTDLNGNILKNAPKKDAPFTIVNSHTFFYGLTFQSNREEADG